MKNNPNLEFTLAEIRSIRLEGDRMTSKKGFNIFSVLRNPHEEVGLHSRFLQDILSPSGSHNKGDTFLLLFLKVFRLDKFKLLNTEVVSERWNIDLLIQNNRQAIIIENKIYAGDQPKQLERYFNSIKQSGIEEDNIKIIYLTLDGKMPSRKSIGGLKNQFLERHLICASYINDILPFIDLCIKECPLDPALRESLNQYKQIVKNLTMSEKIAIRQELLATLGQGDRIKDAHFLVKNWVHMKWHIEMNFWNELYAKVPNHYNHLEIYTYSRDTLNASIHKSRNRDIEYGVAFELFKSNGDAICLFIDRGESRLEYGIIADYELEEGQEWENNHKDFIKYLSSFSDETNLDSYWLAWKNPKANISFENFDNDDTLALANPEKRTKIINELWAEVEEYIKKVEIWNQK